MEDTKTNNCKEFTVHREAIVFSRQFDALIEHMTDAVDVVDLHGKILKVNDAFEKIYGWTREEMVGQALPIIPLHLLEEGKSLHQMVKKGHQVTDFHTSRLRRDGTMINILLTVAPLVDVNGNVLGHVGISRDISDKKKVLTDYTSTDELTNLQNRMSFLDLANNHLNDSKMISDTKMALIILDLDRFGQINHSLGQVVGDILLREVAKRLVELVGNDNVIARLGNDQFAMLFTKIVRLQEVSELIKMITESIHTPFYHLNGAETFITASLGISIFPKHGQDLDSLLEKANLALNRAKRAGGNTFRIYHKGLWANSAERFVLGNELRKALEREQFEVFYQPMVDIQTGRIQALEALLRWNHPLRGWISPTEFIPVAEETGLINSIGFWVLRKACADIKKLHLQGTGPLKVAVNLSALQFENTLLSTQIRGILHENELEGTSLELEITETAMIQNTETTITLMKQLRAMGIEISLDDFGTGYSSLINLKRFPIDKVKIDKSFLHSGQEEDVTIINFIIDIAKKLDMKVIAEGVESNEHLIFLKSCKCDVFQGYLISKPIPFDAVKKFLKKCGDL